MAKIWTYMVSFFLDCVYSQVYWGVISPVILEGQCSNVLYVSPGAAALRVYTMQGSRGSAHFQVNNTCCDCI